MGLQGLRVRNGNRSSGNGTHQSPLQHPSEWQQHQHQQDSYLHTSHPNPQDVAEVAALLSRWGQAVQSGDPLLLASLYCPQGMLVQVPSASHEGGDASVTPGTHLSQGFQPLAALRTAPTILSSSVHMLSSTVAVCRGTYSFNIRRAPPPQRPAHLTPSLPYPVPVPLSTPNEAQHLAAAEEAQQQPQRRPQLVSTLAKQSRASGRPALVMNRRTVEDDGSPGGSSSSSSGSWGVAGSHSPQTADGGSSSSSSWQDAAGTSMPPALTTASSSLDAAAAMHAAYAAGASGWDDAAAAAAMHPSESYGESMEVKVAAFVFVYCKVGDKWLIAEHHSRRVPGSG